MRQRNSFDSLRLFGSLMVLVGHAFIITGGAAPNIGTIPLHALGVCMFFAVSGFLITQSWMSDSNWPRYILRRLLRIIPALMVVTTITALVIGALGTNQSLSEYYRHGWTWRYIVSNSMLITVWGLPGVFDTLPIRGQANGSLWTLPIEFGLYLLTPFLVLIGRHLGRYGPLCITVLAFAILALDHLLPNLSSLNVRGIDIGKGLAPVPYFWIGAALRLADLDAWPVRTRQAALAVSFLTVVAWSLAALPALLPIGIIAIAVLVLTIGISDHFHSEALTRLGDLSYGTYLWAFPIQQFAYAKLGGGPALNIAVAVPVACGIAYCSWHVIERPAIRFKPRRRLRPQEEHGSASGRQVLQSPI